MRILLLVLAFVILISAEVFKVYYIMPFPGSQQDEIISVAYFLNQYILYIRIIGWLLLLYALFINWQYISLSGKVVVGIVFAFYLFIAIHFNFYFVADHIFYQTRNKRFASGADNKIKPGQLVLGVFING